MPLEEEEEEEEEETITHYSSSNKWIIVHIALSQQSPFAVCR